MTLFSNLLSFVNPVVPLSRATQGGLQYGHQITVKGMFLQSCGTRFAVNFQTGFSDNDIAFHFNPRFEEGGYVVCNTKQKKWSKKEERMMINPFQMGIPFEISFLVENSGFQVKVNGQDFTMYTHRVPFHLVDTISFTGGVEVKQISIEEAMWFQKEPSLGITLNLAEIPALPLSPAVDLRQDFRAVPVQKMISEVESYRSPFGSPESEKQKSEPPSYWQATAGPIMQTVIHTVQSIPGQMFPNSIIPPMAYSSPPGGHHLETAKTNPLI